MNFEEDFVYHVYNRGNNHQKIFFTADNYQFFLKKVAKEMLPYCEMLAYCLMPNHFHFLIQARSETPKKTGQTARSGQTDYHPLVRKIGTLLSSYTQAINKQHGRSGSLFQQKTKAKCLNFSNSKIDYAFTCFNYIHQNPINAGLVSKMEDWEYSSFQEYIGQSTNAICNQTLAEEIINFDRSSFYNQSYCAIDEKRIMNLW